MTDTTGTSRRDAKDDLASAIDDARQALQLAVQVSPPTPDLQETAESVAEAQEALESGDADLDAILARLQSAVERLRDALPEGVSGRETVEALIQAMQDSLDQAKQALASQ